MKLVGATALVTGSNRGMGAQFVEQLLERGAARVYAATRNPDAVQRIPGVEVLTLDVTDQSAIAAAAAAAQDTSLLINNAGSSTNQRLVDGDLDKIRLEMDTHYYGTLNMVRAFAPILRANGGGAILNMLSALSWLAFDGVGAYCSAKSAEWGLTNSVRLELVDQRTQVTGLLVGSVDTDMMAGWDVPKADPKLVVEKALDGIEAGTLEVLADDGTVQLKSALSQDPSVLYPNTSPSKWSMTS
ncbi:SDR family oxidoreductase [uncultured Jatrophihabitans sp.]|uniref:SDR family oxidoreductase n=1 Tax=uncultured Jatrophihabitans sp. TaxID=1610747 RepID=UPI0035CA9164